MAAAGGFSEVVRVLLNMEDSDVMARTDVEVCSFSNSRRLVTSTSTRCFILKLYNTNFIQDFGSRRSYKIIVVQI